MSALSHGVHPGTSGLLRWLLWLPAITGVVLPSLAAEFRFAPVDEKSLGLWEGDKPVFVYNHGVISKAGVPADRARSTYIHPLYGLDGEVLTDDFPKDHYHHRGLFWAWPHVKVDGKEYDLWMLKGCEQKFEKWLIQKAGAVAILSAENSWHAGGKKILREEVTFAVQRSQGDSRVIDVQLNLTPLGEAVTLAGAEGKSYGGLTLRFAPRTNTVITTPLGNGSEDLPMTRLPWADLTAEFPGVPRPIGAAILVSPSHPDFPPMWLTRHYGVLCLGWPGTEPEALKPDQTVNLRYRVWIHRGAVSSTRLKDTFSDFERSPFKFAPASGGAE